MTDQGDKSIEFWQRTFNKVFWLGVAGVVALGLNTVALLAEKNRKKSKKEEKEKEGKDRLLNTPDKKEARNSRINSADPLAGIPPLSLDGPELKASRKGSLVPHTMDPHNPHQIHRIVFTGGPCGGRSA